MNKISRLSLDATYVLAQIAAVSICTVAGILRAEVWQFWQPVLPSAMIIIVAITTLNARLRHQSPRWLRDFIDGDVHVWLAVAVVIGATGYATIYYQNLGLPIVTVAALSIFAGVQFQLKDSIHFWIALGLATLLNFSKPNLYTYLLALPYCLSLSLLLVTDPFAGLMVRDRRRDAGRLRRVSSLHLLWLLLALPLAIPWNTSWLNFEFDTLPTPPSSNSSILFQLVILLGLATIMGYLYYNAANARPRRGGQGGPVCGGFRHG